jgi:hypothetical protein
MKKKELESMKSNFPARNISLREIAAIFSADVSVTRLTEIPPFLGKISQT